MEAGAPRSGCFVGGVLAGLRDRCKFVYKSAAQQLPPFHQTAKPQIESAWGLQRPFVCSPLPFATSFNCGFGRGLYENGQLLDGRAWLHLSSTQLLPSACVAGGGAASAAVEEGQAAAAAPQRGRLRLQLTTETAFEGGSCVAVLLTPASQPQQQEDQQRQQQQEDGPSRVHAAQLYSWHLPVPPQTRSLKVECVAQITAGTAAGAEPLCALQLHFGHANGSGTGSSIALLMQPASKKGNKHTAALAAALAGSGASIVLGADASAACPGGWRRWRWRVSKELLGGAGAITGCSVAVAAAGGEGSCLGAAAAGAKEAGAAAAAAVALLGEFVCFWLCLRPGTTLCHS